MTEPERGESTDFERWLLDAGKRERPSRGLQRHMRLGLGLSTLGVGTAWAAGGILTVGIAVGLALGSPAGQENPPPPREQRALSVSAMPAPKGPAPTPSVETVTEQPVAKRARNLASASAPLSDGVRDEIKLLDEARAALAAGNATAALATLNRYARRHPAGVLAPEAWALREKALAAASKPGGSR